MSETKTAPVTKRSAAEDLFSSVLLQRAEIEAILPKAVPFEVFFRGLKISVAQTPKLLECGRNGLLTEVAKCAKDGLVPDGREAALLPFKGEAKYSPTVYGLCKRARNSGEISTIQAEVVHDEDAFEYWIDETGPHIKHRPSINERGEMSCAYATVRLKDGSVFVEVMQLAELKALAEMSRGDVYKGPFKNEMFRKGPLRRLLKYRVPSASDLSETIGRDDDMHDLSRAAPVEREQDRPKTSRLEQAVGAAPKPDEDNIPFDQADDGNETL